MGNLMAKRIALILAVYVLVAGCATQEDPRYVRDGEQYGTTQGVFRGRWWSYYERGSSFVAGKFYLEAIRDFQTALQGRERDTWRARTYGLHFVEFFPNRELGVAYFHLGQLDEAEAALRNSLASIDTERAHYYLDEVKKAKIASGALKDDLSPELDTTVGMPMVIASNLAPPAANPAPVAPAAPPSVDTTPATPAPAPVATVETPPAPKPEPKAEPVAKPAPKPEAKPVAQTAQAPAAKPAAAPKPAEKPAPAEAPKAPEAPKPAAPAPAPAPEPPAPKAEEPAAPAPPAPVVAEAAPAVPTPAPTIAPAPAPRLITEPTVPIQVAAKDDVGVREVTVNGKQLRQRGSQESISFRSDVSLKEGAQTIEIVAKDLAQKETRQEVAVVVDMTGPSIGVFSPIEPTVTPDGTVLLEGATVDKNGVATVTVGERLIAEAPGAKKLPFNTELPLGQGENTFILAAKDIGGNETRSAIKVFRGDPNSQEAKLWLLQQKRPDLFLYAQSGAADVSTLLRIAQEQAAAKSPNEIRLKSPQPEQVYRNNRTLRISGEVVTGSAVKWITINGEQVNDISGAPKESFNRRLAIDPDLAATGGAMAIEILAEDANGQRLEKRFTVNLQPIALNNPESKMPVAVLAFAGNGVDTSVSEMLRVTTEAEMVAQQRFRAVDRVRLQEVLNEQQLSAVLGDPAQALTLGRLASAQVFLVADVFPQDANGLEIKARAVSTETSELIATLDVFIENRNDANLVRRKCAELVGQLGALYPRLSGDVVAARGAGTGAEVLVNWTLEDGVRPGAYVLLLKQTPDWVDESTGEIIEPGELVETGRARVEAVSDTNTRAVTIERKEEGVPVEQGMPAITM